MRPPNPSRALHPLADDCQTPHKIAAGDKRRCRGHFRSGFPIPEYQGSPVQWPPPEDVRNRSIRVPSVRVRQNLVQSIPRHARLQSLIRKAANRCWLGLGNCDQIRAHSVKIMSRTVCQNQNIKGLTEKEFHLSLRSWSGIQIPEQVEHKDWSISPGFWVYTALRPGITMEKNLKHYNSYARDVTSLEKELKQQKYSGFCFFQGKTLQLTSCIK